MIVSATRRADIPALYAGWFMNRVRAGWCAVPNPFNARQVSRVSLTPEDVDALVFWTRDVRPMLPHLPELDQRGFNYVFQFTVVEYPPELHCAAAPLAGRLEGLSRLVELISPERVLWRYDPIVISAGTDPDFHRKSFESLARALSGLTRRVTVSLLEPYRKIRKRLALAGADLLAPGEADLAGMFTDLANLARVHNMEPVSCADEAGLAAFGFAPGACVDAELLSGLFGLDLPPGRDASQRPACRCAPSRDIGMYDACTAGCAYCYATRDFATALRNRADHDPNSPSLLGRHEPRSVPADIQHRLVP